MANPVQEFHCESLISEKIEKNPQYGQNSAIFCLRQVQGKRPHNGVGLWKRSTLACHTGHPCQYPQ
jgi:hypothetical protein